MLKLTNTNPIVNTYFIFFHKLPQTPPLAKIKNTVIVAKTPPYPHKTKLIKMPHPLPPYNWPVFQSGWVWLCGAGPGDAGLLTLHALNGLNQADTIVYDALVADEILQWSSPNAEKYTRANAAANPRQNRTIYR